MEPDSKAEGSFVGLAAPRRQPTQRGCAPRPTRLPAEFRHPAAAGGSRPARTRSVLTRPCRSRCPTSRTRPSAAALGGSVLLGRAAQAPDDVSPPVRPVALWGRDRGSVAPSPTRHACDVRGRRGGMRDTAADEPVDASTARHACLNSPADRDEGWWIMADKPHDVADPTDPTCPTCKSPNTIPVGTVPGDPMKQRRKCPACGRQFERERPERQDDKSPPRP